MRCDQVQPMLPAFVDTAQPRAECREDLDAIALHIDSCSACAAKLGQLQRVRQSLRRLPERQMPASLNASLKVLASRERARVLHTDISWTDRARLFVQSSMRPFALPAVGGVLCSVVLFSMFMPALAIPVHAMTSIRDVPTMLTTGASVSYVRYPASFPLGADCELVIDLTIDEQGHMVDYAVVQGEAILKDASVRRQLENGLLFTEFTPGTKFGGAAVSKVRLMIQTSHVTVEG